jgi:alkylation response protein AidB-like acyl-CoA dehydrogenase
LTAATALILGGSEAQKAAWLPKIAAGEIVATLAVDETAHHHPSTIALTATPSGSGYVLNGTKSFVLDGGAADLLIVVARTSGAKSDEAGISLFLVEGSAKGLERKSLTMVDSRAVANLTLSNVEVTADATENRHLFWASAAEALRLADEEAIRIIFPTRRNLERLAQFDDFTGARDHAQATPIITVTPRGTTKVAPSESGRPARSVPI